jgi:uncharacterized membrane protein HdeD (DUF308 family)
MRTDLLLSGVILILVGLVVCFIPIQLAPANSLANNYWIGIPILFVGIIAIQLGIVFKKLEQQPK